VFEILFPIADELEVRKLVRATDVKVRYVDDDSAATMWYGFDSEDEMNVAYFACIPLIAAQMKLTELNEQPELVQPAYGKKEDQADNFPDE
jgi:hypothetical protein